MILVTVVGLFLMQNSVIYDAVQTCRSEHRFAWNRKNVRTDLLCFFGTLLVVLVILGVEGALT